MSREEILVKVEGVGKKFCRDLKTSLWYGVKDLAGEFFGVDGDKSTLRKKEFWAVKDVSFELRRGECLGLIGHNGAGKSTLLKMLNGLIKPDTGQITMKGRIGALIELGTGFNPVLTGRENIYINGQILGFTKREIDRKLNEIIDFAEIGEFIDAPVRSYSSGMKVRLGFAVAAQMEPDVLIIDEVLAVGDVGFRTKCFNKINELISSSSVILVSHSMPNIGKLSSSILLMNKGKAEYLGDDTYLAIEKYFAKYASEKMIVFGDKITLSSIKIDGGESKVCHGSAFRMDLDLQLKTKVRYLGVFIVFLDKELKPVAMVSNERIKIQNESFNLRVTIDALLLTPGKYTVTINFHGFETEYDKRWTILSKIQSAAEIEVFGKSLITHTPILFQADWSLYNKNT